MSSSLDELSSYLSSSKKVILHKEFNNLSIEKIKLLERKGIFPYDYVDHIGKLNDDDINGQTIHLLI